jgi:UDP-2,3-diacylglucosamine pyrophosphatase LpxH
MTIIEIPNSYTTLNVVGDIHGDFQINTLFKWVSADKRSDTAFIIAGDFGVGFKDDKYYERALGTLNTELLKRNCAIYVIRGNHDDPKWFSGETNRTGVYGSNITFISDYTVLTYNEGNILCVGGGISIDREFRSGYKSRLSLTPAYWAEEVVVYNEAAIEEIVNSGISIDALITHTVGRYKPTTDTSNIDYFLRGDVNLEADLNAESELMDGVFDKLISMGCIITRWIHGHFHRSKTTMVPIQGWACYIVSLGINERYEFDKI